MLFSQKTALFFEYIQKALFRQRCCVACFSPFTPPQYTPAVMPTAVSLTIPPFTQVRPTQESIQEEVSKENSLAIQAYPPLLLEHLCPQCAANMPPPLLQACSLCGRPLPPMEPVHKKAHETTSQIIPTVTHNVITIKKAQYQQIRKQNKETIPAQKHTKIQLHSKPQDTAQGQQQEIQQKPQQAAHCLSCRTHPPSWDALQAYAHYTDVLKILLLKYKFSANFAAIPLLSSLLANSCHALPPADILIPMPRHTKRLGIQGFDHILELCRPLEKALGIPLGLHHFRRTHFTPPQASLPAAQRKNNPKNSFYAQDLVHKRVLLVDDIMTTGATLQHASLALRKAGATRIYVALIARVPQLD